MTPFRKGVSGNPKGAKPKAAEERRARLVTTVAPATLRALKRRAESEPRGSIGAAIDALVAAAERTRTQ